MRWWCVGSALVALVAMAVASGPAVAGADAVPESITDWQQVDGGTAHTCGLTGAGRIYCWGSNGRGALGIGVWGGVRTTPTLARGTKWAAVSAGDFTTCALKTTGRLFCWGADGSGQRGDGNGRKASPVPVQVAGGHTDWTSVSSGALTTCGIRSGRLFCWGADTFGALGNGGRDVARNKPVEVAGGATNWASVSVGLFGACARKTTGRVSCWGDDSHGASGDGGATVTATRRPSPVANGTTTWASVTAGLGHRCATRTGGRLFCWGDSTQSALGLPGQNPVDANVPTEVTGGRTDWAEVAGGTSATCARTTAQTIECWGDNSFRQLGDNSAFPFRAAPTPVAGGIADWVSVTAAEGYACAIRTGGALYCWGRNDLGQLGLGPASGTPVVGVPTQVAP